MGTYTKNLKLETPNYTDNADIPTLVKKNNEILDNEMIKRANGLDYTEQTGVLQLTGNGSKLGSPIQIKNNLPVTAMSSGTKLKLNNNKELIKLSVDGKTEQKSYTGKNILDYVSNLKVSSNGLTNVINDDGSITTTGKPTSNYTTITKGVDLIDLLEDGETYTISQEKYNTNIYIQITARKKDGTYTYYGTANTQKKASIKVDKTIYSNYYCSIQSNSTANWGDSSLTITNKYMLCKGIDAADTSFEPYVGGEGESSPSPDYPQKIENIRGVENIWFGGESTTNNGITFTKNADGSYDITGTATAEANCYNFMNIANTKLKNGINYIISINKLTDTNVGILTEAYAGETWLKHIINGINTKTDLLSSKTVIVEDNITRIRYGLRVTKGTTVDVKGLKIQLEEGIVVHDFVPNGSNYLQLKNSTDNESKIINIDLKGNELCSDKEQTLKDELVIENGRAKIIKKYDEYVFTGNETLITQDQTKSGLYRYNYQISNLIQGYQKVISTHFKTTSQTQFINVTEISINSHPNQPHLCFFTEFATTDEFKTWLKSQYDSGTPVKVQYELAEPKVIDLGEVDLELLENSTLTCDEEPNMQIDYLTIDSNIFVQDSLDGNSSQKAPSVKAVNEAFDKISSYSSNEQLIGKWINGENLYRKVFEINMDSSSKEMTVSTGISNMKQLTHAYGVGLYQNTIYIPLNFYNNLGWDSFHLTSKGANIILQRGDNFSITKVYITIEYTKNV